MATRRSVNALDKAIRTKATAKADEVMPTRRPLKPFRAADHPSRDFRGEKIVGGVKMRI